MWSSNKPTERPRESKRLTDAPVKPHVEGPTWFSEISCRSEVRVRSVCCAALPAEVETSSQPHVRGDQTRPVALKLLQQLSLICSEQQHVLTDWLTHSVAVQWAESRGRCRTHHFLHPHPAALKLQQGLSSHNTENKSHPGVWGRAEKLFGHWNKTNWTVFLITSKGL